MPDYASRVASVTGLTRQAGSLGFSKKIIMVGMRDGYLVSIDPKPLLDWRVTSEDRAIQIVARTGGIKEPIRLEAALQHRLKRLGWTTELAVDDSSVTLLLPYILIRPAPEKVNTALMDVVGTLNSQADHCTKCDKCGVEQSLDILFVGPEPELLCPRCRAQLLDETAAREERYAKLPVHLGPAAVLTGIVSIVGAELVAHLWSRFSHNLKEVSPFFYATGVLGLVIGFIAGSSAGKLTGRVKVLGYSATALGVWIALLRSLRLNDSTVPLGGWDPGAVFLLGLWCTWLPLLLAHLGMLVGRTKP
jgi:hypothetical protein